MNILGTFNVNKLHNIKETKDNQSMIYLNKTNNTQFACSVIDVYKQFTEIGFKE